MDDVLGVDLESTVHDTFSFLLELLQDLGFPITNLSYGAPAWHVKQFRPYNQYQRIHSNGASRKISRSYQTMSQNQ